MLSKLQIFLFFVLAVFLNTANSYSQEIIGYGNVGGKSVEIFSNFTWRYKQTQESNGDCEQLSENISFCNSKAWRVTSNTGEATAMYLIDDRHYAMFIIEGLGSNDGFSEDVMAEVAIGYAADAANVQKNSIPINNRGSITIDGKQALSLGYSAKIDNVPFTYQNNIYVGKSFTMQAIIFGVGGASSKIENFNRSFIKDILITD